MQLRAKLYIGFFCAVGLWCFGYAMAHWSCADPLHYLSHIALAVIASGLKVMLPGITGTMSVSYVFVLLSMMDFSYPETTVVACLAIAAQSLWRTKSPPRALQLAFNLASMTIAVAVGFAVFHLFALRGQTLAI